MRKMSDSALQILRERYFLRNDKGEIIEDWEGLCKRVSSFVASCEKDKEHWAKEFYDIIYNRLFLPNTPTLMNAATGCNTMAACFVLDIEDTMGNEKQGHSITDAWKAAALIGQAGGGIGYPLSKLRPRGDRIKTSGGKSTGPIPLILGVLNEIAEAVKQGGRRRIAQMGIMRVNHPDIIEFIQCKNQEGKINNFNISVGITDEFMDCLTNNKDFNLINPKDGSIHSTIKPWEIWKEIITGAWLNGEPGVVFIDTINKYHNLKKLGTIEATNPCLSSDTLLMESIDGKLVRINNNTSSGEWISWKTGIKKCIKVITNAGYEIICTPDHRIMLENKEYIEAKDSLGKQIYWATGNRNVTNIDELQVARGFLFGDGFLCGSKLGISVKINKEKEPEICDLLERQGFTWQDSGQLYLNKKSFKADVDFLYNKVFDRIIPEEIVTGESNLVASFLRGVFEANGSINAHNQISLKGTCLKNIKLIQILLSSFGIKSWITINKPQEIEWDNGTYISKESYNLQIAPRNVWAFKQTIGFYSKHKDSKIIKNTNNYRGKLIVTKIEEFEEIEVWDFKKSSGYPCGLCNGIIAHNCSEQPLLAYESCVLGSIDLGKFIEFGKKFDYDKYKNVIQIATRFLDNIVSLQISPISEIDKTTQANRKIGLGVMGFADALIKMEIPYGSSESYKIAEELGLCLKVEAHNESVRLAKEKGDSESSQYYENAMTWLDIKGTPRNACVTTQAPTGTIASIADASFGIEPLYDVCFIKNILDGKKIFFTSPIVKEFLEYKGYGKLCKEIESGKTLDELNLPKEIKDILVVSYKLTPEQHVKIQSAWQKYCDSAISKTVNMSNSATIDDVDKTYKMAYQLNCKGITVYRDGSRNLQVVEIGKGKQKKSKIIHRGDVVNGLTYRIPTSLGKMYLTINFTEDKTPIEIFISMSDISNDMQTMFSSLTRMISVSFKHSVPVKDVIKQLKRVKNGDTPIFYNEQAFKSFPQLIGHVLENIFLEDNKVEVNTSCNKCGGTLVLQEGCECCLSCGYSKC